MRFMPVGGSHDGPSLHVATLRKIIVGESSSAQYRRSLGALVKSVYFFEGGSRSALLHC